MRNSLGSWHESPARRTYCASEVAAAAAAAAAGGGACDWLLDGVGAGAGAAGAAADDVVVFVRHRRLRWPGRWPGALTMYTDESPKMSNTRWNGGSAVQRDKFRGHIASWASGLWSHVGSVGGSSMLRSGGSRSGSTTGCVPLSVTCPVRTLRAPGPMMNVVLGLLKSCG